MTALAVLWLDERINNGPYHPLSKQIMRMCFAITAQGIPRKYALFGNKNLKQDELWRTQQRLTVPKSPQLYRRPPLYKLKAEPTSA